MRSRQFVNRLLRKGHLFLKRSIIPISSSIRQILNRRRQFGVLFLQLHTSSTRISRTFLSTSFSFLQTIFMRIRFGLQMFLLRNTRGINRSKNTHSQQRTSRSYPLFRLGFVFGIHLRIFRRRSSTFNIKRRSHANVNRFSNLNVTRRRSSTRFFFRNLSNATSNKLKGIRHPHHFTR